MKKINHECVGKKKFNELMEEEPRKLTQGCAPGLPQAAPADFKIGFNVLGNFLIKKKYKKKIMNKECFGKVLMNKECFGIF